jgi:Ca2+/H+ antiporter
MARRKDERLVPGPNTMNTTFYLAAILPTGLLPETAQKSRGMNEWLILLGALAVVTCLVFVWAVFFRHRLRRHHHHHARHHSHDRTASSGSGGGGESLSTSDKRRSRRRKKEHRPRNPTLAETGGLPPARSQPPPEAAP